MKLGKNLNWHHKKMKLFLNKTSQYYKIKVNHFKFLKMKTLKMKWTQSNRYQMNFPCKLECQRMIAYQKKLQYHCHRKLLITNRRSKIYHQWKKKLQKSPQSRQLRNNILIRLNRLPQNHQMSLKLSRAFLIPRHTVSKVISRI